MEKLARLRVKGPPYDPTAGATRSILTSLNEMTDNRLETLADTMQRVDPYDVEYPGRTRLQTEVFISGRSNATTSLGGASKLGTIAEADAEVLWIESRKILIRFPKYDPYGLNPVEQLHLSKNAALERVLSAAALFQGRHSEPERKGIDLSNEERQRF